MQIIFTAKTKRVVSTSNRCCGIRELGWDIGEEISPHIYTKKQWKEWTFLPFYKNVERDKIVIV